MEEKEVRERKGGWIEVKGEKRERERGEERERKGGWKEERWKRKK